MAPTQALAPTEAPIEAQAPAYSEAGRVLCETAYLAADRTGDPEALAVAVLGYAGLRLDQHRTCEASSLLQVRLEQALSLVDPHSSLALRLRARLAAESGYRRGQHQSILAVLAEARQASDPLVRAEVLHLAHQCVLGPEHGALRQDLAGELIRDSFRTGRRNDLLLGLLWQTVDLILDGDRQAERRLGELRELLTEHDDRPIGFIAGAIEVMLAIRAGRFGEAELLAGAGAERGSAAGDLDATAWYWAQLVTIRWYQGRLADVLPLLTQVVHSPTLSAVDSSHLALLAVAAATAGDHRLAAGTLARLRGRDLADLPRSSSWLATMHGIVEAANLLEDVATCDRAYELLAPFAHLPVVTGLGASCFGSAHHTLGVAALTGGRLDEAVEHFRSAIDGNLALGHWPALRISRLRYAEALTRRGRSRDADTASDQLAAADRDAVSLGLSLPSPAEPIGLAARCTREGRLWRVQLGAHHALVEHCIGMLHLAVLLANPESEIPAMDLAAGVAALGSSDGRTGFSAQPVLDRVAAQQYRQRLSQVNAEIEDHDPERSARARAERDWIVAELAAGTGLGGRPRHVPDSAERARLAVGKAIRRAIARIDAADPVTGGHLRRSVHTGVRCWYLPA